MQSVTRTFRQSGKPVVSVVVPLYNKADTVEHALRSVLAQTVEDYEVIVVDDGSTDEGPDRVESITERRIRLIHQENQGVSAARNRGIAESQADLIAFLDADDEWKPWFLEEVLSLRHDYPSASVFATNYCFCDRLSENRDRHPTSCDHGAVDLEVSGASPRFQFSLPLVRGLPPHPWRGIIHDYFAVAAESDPPLWSSAVAVSKHAIESVGGFPAGVTSGEDLLTWARLAVESEIAYSTRASAVFWRPRLGWDALPRRPAVPDVVARGLAELTDGAGAARRPSLAAYLALWHKMRASSLIALGERDAARDEIRRAITANRLTFRLLVMALLTMIPGSSQFMFLVKRSQRRFRCWRRALSTCVPR